MAPARPAPCVSAGSASRRGPRPHCTIKQEARRGKSRADVGVARAAPSQPQWQAAALLPSSELLSRPARLWLLGLVEWAGRLVPGRPIAGQARKLVGMMASLLGGPPDAVLYLHDSTSPASHAGPLCPLTLLTHGEHDTAVPVDVARTLYDKLVAAGVLPGDPSTDGPHLRPPPAAGIATSQGGLGESGPLPGRAGTA